ncbi:MAG: hypothetical protein JWQ30_365 [Sediminibacterium sp.]|nr:hypothetical protein [Sediminibacterium sp.]
MSTKLTLSIDENVVSEAKEYAKESGKSLSKIIEGYLRGLKNKKNSARQDELPPVLKRLHGCIKSDDMRDYKDIYADGLVEKYNKL